MVYRTVKLLVEIELEIHDDISSSQAVAQIHSEATEGRGELILASFPGRSNEGDQEVTLKAMYLKQIL